MTSTGTWGKTTSPYHRGERALHKRYGRDEQQTAMAHNIHHPEMEPSHQQFLAGLEYLVLGSIDEQNRPWASILFGQPGFAHALDSKTVDIDATTLPGDRLAANLAVGSPMSILGIELATKQRIRANVTFLEQLDPGLRVQIDQSYGNCPKYIHPRSLDSATLGAGDTSAQIDEFTSLPDHAASLIASADTLFVSSYNHEDDQHDVGGVDVNHRGGRPGFVRVEGNTLTIPDYAGNFAFNTLGNFLINPVAGLLFVDFETGDVLQLTGRTEILWEDDPAIANFDGARRGWTFTIEEGTFAHGVSPAKWEFGEFSRNVARTGTWAEIGNVQS